jgi:hypothetical protein
MARRALATTEDRRRALTVLALHSDDAHAASRALKAQGHQPISPRTLKRYAERYPELLEEVRQEVVGKIHRKIAAEQEATAREATQAAREYVAQARQDLTAGKVKDSASGARNLETVAGIALDKLLPMRDKPTHITEVRHADSLLEELERVLPKRFDAESTVEELGPEAQLPPAA